MLFGYQHVHKKHWTPAKELLDSVASRRDVTLRGFHSGLEVIMADEPKNSRKPPTRATLAPEEKLLVGKDEAAQMLSISRRALDYLVAKKQLSSRRIGSRVLIPTTELKRFSRLDHPSRLAG